MTSIIINKGKRRCWKLIRLDSFGGISIYYLEGTKGDLFSLIGYIYSCEDVGTDRIDYKKVPAIDTLSNTLLYAISEDFSLAYYYGGTSNGRD